ncbi:MAG: endonuclease V [Acidobacteriia bacterium]|nr:endonuclease V [Terriglobia bacterium]
MSLEIATWPATPDELIRIQHKLATVSPEPWVIGDALRAVAGCWICHPKGREGKGAAGDPCWAAAALVVDGRLSAVEVARGEAPAAYQPGLLALREGPLLEEAVLRLPERPEVLLVNATGRDHPRRAGLAVHLGAKLSLPTVGVTRQPLLADGPWPARERGAAAPLHIEEEVVACRLCTRRGTLPLVVHPAWRTRLDTAVAVVMATTGRCRTPEPLRQARSSAREARARAGGVGIVPHGD